MLQFRDLRADEIDVRIATVSENGMSLLLYKDARCDMNILDETVGAFNWQRTHSRDNANCTVSIWDEAKKQWISKEDVGTESNTEAQKGLASDSFKRACFNWGIGRELYTAPFIWVYPDKFKDKKDKFSVQEIKIENKKITALTIYNTTKKCVAYTMGKGKAKETAQPKQQAKPAAENAEPTTQPEMNSDLPFEIGNEPVETNRDKFRNFVVGMDSKVIGKIMRDCGLKEDSTDAEWQAALMKAIAVKAGATI